MTNTGHASSAASRLKLMIKLALIVGFLVMLNYGGGMVVKSVNIQLWPEHEHIIIAALWFSIGVYVLWMALPFVPGIELGVGLMLLLGTRGVLLVYICTLISLSLSYVIGRLIPLDAMARLLGWLRMHKSQEMMVQLGAFNSEQKMEFLLKSVPSRIVPVLVRHRYLMIALVLNLPGNALIGGGGGVGLVAGMSGLCSYPKYLLLVAVAITPLPLLFLVGNWKGG